MPTMVKALVLTRKLEPTTNGSLPNFCRQA